MATCSCGRSRVARYLWRGWMLSALTACLSISAFAETIVLKNGRRILASNVVEIGDKVKYETSAGELTIPKGIVDHVEKGGFVDMNSSSAAVAALAVTPPASAPNPANLEIQQRTIHGGAIDREYIASLEANAKTGTSEAVISAALAHHAAGEFELAHGDMDRALVDERTALNYAPEDSGLLLNVAYLHLRRSEFKQSLDYLDRARRVAPDNPDIPKLAGWSYYGLNKIDQAVTEWKRSLALRADPDVQSALDKALRDKQEEDGYRENESAHFKLRYSGAAEPQLAREVLHALEAHYTNIGGELNFEPPDSIGVILYTQDAFADITRAPEWVGALNDGRIRVPVQGLTSITPELSRILKHELTHSFIQQKTHGHAPTWLQEGLAQWMEGKRSGDAAAELVQVYAAGRATPLADLERSWMALPREEVADAYAWALANVETIVQVGGLGDVERILDRLAAGATPEAALREVLRDSYAELSSATADYLKKNYVR